MNDASARDRTWDELWARAKHVDMVAVAERLGARLRRAGMSFVGACPPGCADHDGFIVTPAKRLFLCRPSGATGDAVDMAVHVRGMTKPEALAFVTGRDPPGRRVETAKSAKSLRDEEAIHAVVKRAQSLEDTHAEAYLRARGLTLQRRLTADLKFVADLDYWAGGPQPLAVLPAMVAIIRDIAGDIIGVHLTYLDPAEPRKWVPPGDTDSAKKIRGRAKGGLIRLGVIGDKLAIGEGIETSLAYHALGVVPEDVAIACGVSLSVMAGGCTATMPHPTMMARNGKPTSIANGDPDMAKPGLILPPCVRELILLGDGDSEPCATRMKVLAAGRRARAQGMTVGVHFAPEGKDWADVQSAAWTGELPPIISLDEFEAQCEACFRPARKPTATLRASGAVKRDPAPPTSGNEAAEPPRFSDLDLALRFGERHAHRLRFVAEWGKWLSWDGECWRFDTTLATFDLARDLCQGEAAKCNTKARKTIASAKTVAAVITLARANRSIAATVDQWDADPWLLNTPDGIVDLRAGQVRPHRQEDYMTKMTATGPRGDCPLFFAFLDRIMGGDEALIAYLRRVFGYCLTGDTSEQAIFFNHGGGQNGKTVLMSTVSGILGDYCVATPIETFTESKSDRHPTELARLRSARLVTATETEAGRHWAESRLKELTGGERIAARFMHKDFFEYLPTFKPVISGNHKPRLRSVGVAMRRRVNMIPFAVKIPDDEKDTQLTAKLKDEWPGILQWMIDGCLDWQERSLAPPEAVTKATDAYFAGEDGYADWIAERCEEVRGFVSRSPDLFASWRDYAEKAGLQAGDTKRFREEMERLGYPLKHKNDGNYYVGLRPRQDRPPSGQDHDPPW